MPISPTACVRLFVAIVVCLMGFGQSVKAQGSTYEAIAFTGEAAPGGGTYDHFDLPRIGADGSVGFVSIDSRTESSFSKVVAGQPGALRVVASTGDKAPGFGSETFQDFQSVSVSKNGLVAFNADAGDEDSGIWVETGGGLALGASAGGRGPNGPFITALGSAGFRAGSIGAKGEEATESGARGVLFFGAPGTLSDVLKEGQILDGKRLQSIYDTSPEENSAGTLVDVNESGSVALKMVATPSATPAPKESIYAGSPGAPTLVAVQDSVAPGLPGAVFQHLSAQPSIAGNGVVAFSSTLASESGGPASAVFAGSPGSLSAVAVQGATVPTTADVIFGNLSGAVVNSTGDVIFRAVIRYPNESSRTGIWLRRKTGPAVLIAVSGINLPTPTGMREVTDVDFAGPGSFNDLHEFVFRASFGADEGIYLADTRPGAPTISISKPAKPRDRVTQAAKITVAGTAADDTGVEKVEYTVAHEVSASRRNANRRGKHFLTSRTKLAKGGASWNFQVPLNLGLNLISIVAIDKLGNRSEPYQVRVLRYECVAQ